MSRSQRERLAFVIHKRRYRESSLLVELFTDLDGRIGVVAKGARQRRGQTSLSTPTQLLRVRLSGRGELKTLTQADPQGRPPVLDGAANLAVFYCNELLLRLTRRGDAQPELFAAYGATLVRLAANDVADALRAFELALLAALGESIPLDVDQAGRPIADDAWYRWSSGVGLLPVGHDTRSEQHRDVVSGDCLRALATDCFATASTRRQARRLMAYLLDEHLGRTPLQSRALLRQYRQLQRESSA